MIVAKTILEQLGGSRFIAMTGAHTFLGGPRELQFHLPAAAGQKINALRIRLTSRDDYEVAFYRVRRRGLKVDVIATHERVHAEDLQRLFTSETGLYTRL